MLRFIVSVKKTDPSARISVLQILPALNAGGVERTTVEMVEALVAAGHGAHVMSGGGRLVAEIERLGGVHHTHTIGSKNLLTLPWRIAAIRRLAILEKIDVIHARSRAPAWPAFLAARAERLPFVTTYHGIYNSGSRLKTRYNSVMARSDFVIANSEFTRAHILKTHGTDPSKITVIPRGVDMDIFDPAKTQAANLRSEWGVPATANLVLLPGRLTGWKGQRVAISALTDLPESTHLVCLGDAQGRDSYVAELWGLAAKLGVKDRLHLPGHFTDMPRAYSAADIVICPSTDPEAFGRTAAEAQAMGKPVIASAHGGALEVVSDARTGWLVPPDDAPALARAILRAPDLPDVGETARARIARNFSKSSLQSATLGVYARAARFAGPSAGDKS